MDKKKKNISIRKEREQSKKLLSKRNLFFMLFTLIVFLLLTFRLGWIQFVKGSEYKEAAYVMQTSTQTIPAKRGTIYDSTGKILAASAEVDTVSINPGSVKYKDDSVVPSEVLAEAFSTIFELDYNTVLEKVNSDSSSITIAKKVEQDKIDALESWMKQNEVTTGINIDSDTKRYYPYNNLASHLIGFCGDDNYGLDGLESKWDSTLAGVAGKKITTLNGARQEIPDEDQVYIEPQDGNDIILTIDANIQSIVEKYLKQAVEENNCLRGGNAIIMDPNTGDILAMATYPDYNLNDPFTINSPSLAETWSKLSSTDRNDALFKMWRNKAVSDGYEPGSTFKLVTAAIALEENLIEPDTSNDLVCNGYEQYYDTKINCWRSWAPHGSQSLREALQNSCNPALMQVGQRIGSKTYYKYLRAFNLIGRTGASVLGEASGQFVDEEDCGVIELATMSFGQRFTITPLQMITAVSAIVNDGILMQPRIVKQVIDTNSNVVTNIDPVEVRQVISKETSETMRDLMESVVTNGTGQYAKVTGYSVGGKTGTSEPSPGKEDEGYIASMIAISPTVNTQVVALVTLYQPTANGHQGGSTAGPVVGQILSEVLPYLGISSADTETTDTESTSTLPDVRNKTISEAKKKLKAAGFRVNISGSENPDETLITDQVPKPGASLKNNSIICLYTAENNARITTTVPNLKGKTAAEATNMLKAKNLNINTTGSGVVVSQDIASGTSVEEGTIVHVTLQKEISDAH